MSLPGSTDPLEAFGHLLGERVEEETWIQDLSTKLEPEEDVLGYIHEFPGVTERGRHGWFMCPCHPRKELNAEGNIVLVHYPLEGE